MAKNQFRFSTGEQLYITQGEFAPALRVESRTVRNWIKKGWLVPHFRLVGGRLQTIFFTREVEAFVNWFFPSLADLDAPCERGSRHDRINSLRAKGRRCANKASQAAMNKRLGTEHDEDGPETNNEGPVNLDHRPERHGSDLTEERWPSSVWDDAAEGER